MLRWLIAVLFLANLLMFAVVQARSVRCRRRAHANRII